MALLELDSSVLNGYLKGRTPIGLDDLGGLDYAVKSHWLTVLAGNASEKAKAEKLGKGTLIKISIELLFHKLVGLDQWPGPLADDKPHDPATGLYLESIKEGFTEDEAARFPYRKPHGLSGGGIWAHEVSDGTIWSPENIKLLGVQSSWDPRGYLYGTRIESVIKLLRG